MPGRAHRFIGLLLRLFPEDFRADYGHEIRTAFFDQHRNTRGWCRFRLWLDTLADFSAGAFKEHWTMTLTDLRISIRRQRLQPGFSAVAILSLALGIGANTSIFSVIHATLLAPLPFHEPSRMVMMWGRPAGTEFRGTVYTADLVDWRKMAKSFKQMEMATGMSRSTVTGGGSPERVGTQNVTPGFFPMLGLKPVIGRYFVEDEVLSREEGLVLLTESYWRSRYGADPGVLGKSIVLNGLGRTIVGVVPADYRAGFLSEGVDVILPIDLSPASEWVQRQVRWVLAIGRLKDGVRIEQAQAEMQTIARQLEETYRESNKDLTVFLEPLGDALGTSWRLILMPLMAAVGFVLLIACANVANLLLARAATRRRELALRSALGASRNRLVRELLADGVVLAIPGALLGLAVALGGIRVFLYFYGNFAQPERLGLSWPVLGFTAGVALLTALLAGVIPAWQASRADVVDALKEGGRGSAGGHRTLVRNGLVVVEMALAVILLVGAGLMLQTIRRIHAVPLGFEPESIVTVRLDVSGTRYTSLAPKQDIDMRYVEPTVTQFYDQVLEQVRSQPWVKQAALASAFPLTPSGAGGGTFSIPGRPDPPPQERSQAQFNCVSDGYFSILRIPVLKGREIAASDRFSGPWVAVVNEAFVRKFLPGVDPIGQQILIRTTTQEQTRKIVGVVADHRRYAQRIPPAPEIYMSYAQQPRLIRGNFQGLRLRPMLAIRGSLDVPGVDAAVRKITGGLDPDLPIIDPALLTKYVDQHSGMQRFYFRLLGLFAALALMLAAVGVYGLMHYAVADRTHEIGIRLALGARRSDVLRMVLSRGVVLALVGLLAGIAGSLAATRLLERFLWNVQRTDVVTMAAVAAVMIAVATGACYIPARRAMAVDPMQALRQD